MSAFTVIKTIPHLLLQYDTAKNGTVRVLFSLSEQRSSVRMDSGRGGPTLKTRKSRSARHVSKKTDLVSSQGTFTQIIVNVMM